MGKDYLDTTVQRYEKRIAYMEQANKNLKEIGITSVRLDRGGTISHPEFVISPTRNFFSKHEGACGFKPFVVHGGTYTSIRKAVDAIMKEKLPEVGTYEKGDESGMNIYVPKPACRDAWETTLKKELDRSAFGD